MTDSPPSSEKPLLPDELGLQERLERLGGVEPAQNPAARHGTGGHSRTSILAWIHSRWSGSWMCMLDADGAAVRVAQDAQDLAQLEERLPPKPPVANRSRSQRLSPWVVTSRSACLRCLVLQRVGVGHEVAARYAWMSSWTRATLLMSSSWVADVLDPADRLVRDPQRLEDLVVEALLAEQRLVDDPQEVAALRALDDPVVVGAGQGEDLAALRLRSSRRSRPATRRGSGRRRR